MVNTDFFGSYIVEGCVERNFYGINPHVQKYRIDDLPEPDQSSSLNRRIYKELKRLNKAAELKDLDDLYDYFRSLHGLMHKACEGINTDQFALSLKAFRIIQLSISTLEIDSVVTQKPYEDA
jgi:hypothetical protein